MRRWVLSVFGASCVLPLAAIDPAAALLLFDVELMALMGSVGLALIRGDARSTWHQIIDSPGMLILRAGIRLTRQRPGSPLDA